MSNAVMRASAERGTPIIEMNAVNKWFGEFQVLTDIDLTVVAGERLVICGPSGSGKSTLIRGINRLEAVQRGRIVVDGTDLTAGGANMAIARAINISISIWFPRSHRLPGDSASSSAAPSHGL
jgi:polar amino acid transport system ATP-binding protein